MKNATAKEAGSVTEHVVSRGQNPWTIARRYKVSLDDLFEWNGWTKVPVLHVGEKVIVRQNWAALRRPGLSGTGAARFLANGVE